MQFLELPFTLISPAEVIEFKDRLSGLMGDFFFSRGQGLDMLGVVPPMKFRMKFLKRLADLRLMPSVSLNPSKFSHTFRS